MRLVGLTERRAAGNRRLGSGGVFVEIRPELVYVCPQPCVLLLQASNDLCQLLSDPSEEKSFLGSACHGLLRALPPQRCPQVIHLHEAIRSEVHSTTE